MYAASGRGEERDHRGDVGRPAEAPGRDPLDDLGRVEPRVRDGVVHDAGVDEAGTDGVHADAARRPLDACHPRQADDRGLRRAVRRAAGAAALGGDRGDVDDAALACGEHDPARGLQAVEDPVQVDVDHVRPVLPAHLLGARVPLDARVVHEQVEPSVLVGDLRDRRLGGPAVADVERPELDAAVRRLARPQAGCDDAPPVRLQAGCDAPPDSLLAPGHDRHPALFHAALFHAASFRHLSSLPCAVGWSSPAGRRLQGSWLRLRFRERYRSHSYTEALLRSVLDPGAPGERRRRRRGPAGG